MILSLLRRVYYGKSTLAMLARGSSSSFVIQILGTALSFVLAILMTRYMGAYEYGLYAYALSWMTLLVVPSMLGFSNALLRFVSQYIVNNDMQHLKGILQRSRQLTLLSSFVLFFIGLIVVYFIREKLGEDLFIIFILMFCLVPFTVYQEWQQSFLRALRLVWQSQLPTQVIRPVLLAVAVYAIFLTKGKVNGVHVIGITILVTIIILIVHWVFLSIATNREMKISQPVFDTRRWLSVSLSLLLISGINIILSQTDMIIIGILLGPSSAGIYATALKTSSFIVFTLNAVNTIAAPLIASLYAENKIEELQRMITTATKWTFWTSFPICIALMLKGDIILSIFGAEFVSARWVLAILAFGQLVNASCGSVGYLMTMTGHQNDSIKILCISALLNIVLNYLLIPHFNIEGAAISTSVSMSIWNLWLMFIVYKKLGIRSSVITSFTRKL